jgi:hypothetical protein
VVPVPVAGEALVGIEGALALQEAREGGMTREELPAGGPAATGEEVAAVASDGVVDQAAEVAGGLPQGTLPAEELLRRYCTLVYARTGSYEAAARRLGLDRRTVKAKVDRDLLEALRFR